MQSNEARGSSRDVIETTECISSISIDLSAESGKNIPVVEQATEADLRGVLKVLGSSLGNTTTVDLLSPATQILTLGHNASFNTSATGEMLVGEIRPVEAVEFAEDHSSTEATTQTVQGIPTSGAVTVIPVNTDLPQWAARLKDCEMIGDSYRGYVNTEAELDILLSIHKEHTQSCWGTRQSPSSAKPSVRLMWKSQYVPYDGIPFLNSGRRAIVMECQYGPRRKGSKMKVEFNDNGEQINKAHRPTCPARIYIKRVRKFPKYRIDPNYEGIAGTRQAQERALAALRSIGVENGGEERFYVQFPLEIAHEYHHDDYVLPQPVSMIIPEHLSATSRLDSRVVEKINEFVARGVTEMYEVKHGVIHFVEKELFDCNGTFPPRHNKTYFPTITDLQNHIYQAKLALEAGTLASLPPPEIFPKNPRKEERSRKRKRSEPRRVRTLKTTAFESIGTLCVQANQLGVQRDGDLQDSQAPLHVSSTGEEINQLGQVFVMVPTTNSLFTTTDSVIGSSSGKTTSLVQMQVVTVPTAGSGYLTQQGDGSLGLSGAYLSLPVNSLPVISYGDNQEISISESQNAVDSLGKEITSLMPSSIGEQTIEQQTSHLHETSSENLSTTTAPISPATITMVTPDITVCENTSEPTISDRIQSFTKSKEPVIIDAMDKNPTVDYLFGNENQVTNKSSPEISSANADMNSIPCSTEESYNSSLDIIKTHEEITSAPLSDIYQGRQNSSFSRTLNSHSPKESSQHISNTTGATAQQSELL